MVRFRIIVALTAFLTLAVLSCIAPRSKLGVAGGYSGAGFFITSSTSNVSNPVAGLTLVWQTSNNNFYYWDGTKWVPVSGVYKVQNYGAIGNDNHNDSPAFQAAFNDCKANHGGTVVDPPTGSLYLLNNGLILPGGCTLKGTNGGWDWGAFYSNNAQDWVQNTFGSNNASGSWLHCNDGTNPCIRTENRASNPGIEGQMMWWTQPTPPLNFTGTWTHNWTPTNWPYAIQINQAMGWKIDDVWMANATNCIDEEGDNISYSSQLSRVRDSMLSCFNVGTNLIYADNYLRFDHTIYTNWWFQDTDDVLGYKQGDPANPGHSIGWQGGFWSTLTADHVQFTQVATAMIPTDLTDGSGDTLAADDVFMTNIYFAACQAIRMGASGTSTRFDVHMANVLLADGGACTRVGGLPISFDLQSDNADVAITNLDGYTAQQGFTVGGGGTHSDVPGFAGVLHLKNVVMRAYSVTSPGASFVTLNTGALLDMPNDALDDIRPAAGAGPRVSGGTPTSLSGFGSGASIVGNDRAGIVTAGTSPSATGFMNFWTAKLNTPSCHADNYTTHAPMSAGASQTQLAITGTMAVGNQISYTCQENQ